MRKRIATWGQRTFTGLHARLYTLTGGRIGGRIGGAPVLLLYTTGRRTGRRRVTPLCYRRDGRSLVLVASNGGAAAHPAWMRNLLALPDVEVRVRRRLLPVRAEPAPPEERARLWPLMVETYPGYQGYQEHTEREIPVVVLRPRPADPTASSASPNTTPADDAGLIQ